MHITVDTIIGDILRRETEAAAPVTTQPAEQPPKTGDAPAVGGLLLAAISGTAAVLCLRRRKAEG